MVGGYLIQARVHVEPATHVPLIFGQWDVLQVAEKNGVPEAQRTASLRGVDALWLPAADELGYRGAGRIDPGLESTAHVSGADVAENTTLNPDVSH